MALGWQCGCAQSRAPRGPAQDASSTKVAAVLSKCAAPGAPGTPAGFRPNASIWAETGLGLVVPSECCHGGKVALGAWKDVCPKQCCPEEGPHQGCGTVGWIFLGNQIPVTLHVTLVVIPHTQEAEESSQVGPANTSAPSTWG